MEESGRLEFQKQRFCLSGGCKTDFFTKVAFVLFFVDVALSDFCTLETSGQNQQFVKPP